MTRTNPKLLTSAQVNDHVIEDKPPINQQFATKQALYEKMQMVAGVKRGRRVPQILVELGDEFVDYEVCDPHDPLHIVEVIRIPRLEAVMRVVYDLALTGDRWCINFLTERMEGKAMQSVMINAAHGDVRDMPTGALIEMMQNQSQVMEQEVQERIKGLIERGVLVPASGDVVHAESHDAQVEKSESTKPE